VADIAASKGIVVITSAGNERNKEWKYITAPADADSVLTVGAVDAGNVISAFSSAGPSADGRIKPDVSAMGVAVPGQGANSVIGSYNGTSLSCPVISGMAACLMQAVPEATGGEIVTVIRQSSDRFSDPDSLYGYGIPDMISALTKLQDDYLINPGEGSAAGPNPTRGEVEITFREPPGAICIEIFSATGAHIYSKEFKIFEGRSILISALNNHSQGLYFIRLKTENGTFVHKIVKLSN
jgi:subtilisin family serine protease